MKPIFLLFLLISSATNAWIIDGLGEFKPEKIAPNVFVIHGPLANPNKQNQGFMNNPAFIISNIGVVVIDPGGTYAVGRKLLKEIEKISKKSVLAVFNTHIHGDHWLANQAFAERYQPTIYAHPQMIKSAKDGEGERWVELMQTLTEGVSKGTKAVYPNQSAQHLQVVKIGTEAFRIHAPLPKSHTNTDIMIEHINSKTLFLGDNSVAKRMARFDTTANMLDSIKILRYAINLNLKHYVPGHGKSGGADTAVKPFLDYLQLIKAETKKGYEADLADYEIKPIAIKKLDSYKNWSAFADNLGAHISKMLLEIEAADLSE